MSNKTIRKYESEIVEYERAITKMKKRQPLWIAALFVIPFIAPILPVRGKMLIDRMPYPVAVFFAFIISAMALPSLYYGTMQEKKKAIYRRKTWIRQLEEE